MTIVKIPKEILRRVAPHDGYAKALKEFVECLQEGRTPSRIYKPSGFAKDGSVFQPYVLLALWHHHLHRKSDPLLVMQLVHEEIVGVALTRHADYFGDKMLWLQTHIEAINWSLCETLKEEVIAYVPPPKILQAPP